MPIASARPYRPEDRAGLRELFERVGEGSPTQTLWHHPESEADIYLNPYLEHEPESCVVGLLDGSVVGYLVGTRGEGAVPSEDDRFTRAIGAHRVYLAPRSIGFFARAALDSLGAGGGSTPVSSATSAGPPTCI